MIKTIFEKGTPIRRDFRRSRRLPDLRRLILLSVFCVLTSLAVTASASAGTLFTNPTPLTIPKSGSDGAASLYPSPIAVSGLTGPITNVAVTLHRFGHTSPDDVDILLVSPSGDTVMLMSDVCGEDDIEDYNWTFSPSRRPARCPATARTAGRPPTGRRTTTTPPAVL